MAVSPPKPYCHTNKRQMYDSQSIQALLPYKQETNVWQSVHPSLTAIKIRDKCMIVSHSSLTAILTVMHRSAIPHVFEWKTGQICFLVLPRCFCRLAVRTYRDEISKDRTPAELFFFRVCLFIERDVLTAWAMALNFPFSKNHLNPFRSHRLWSQWSWLTSVLRDVLIRSLSMNENGNIIQI